MDLSDHTDCCGSECKLFHVVACTFNSCRLVFVHSCRNLPCMDRLTLLKYGSLYLSGLENRPLQI